MRLIGVAFNEPDLDRLDSNVPWSPDIFREIMATNKAVMQEDSFRQIASTHHLAVNAKTLD